MPQPTKPALPAGAVAVRTRPSNYPEPFASRMAGREKRPLGEAFGLTNFGVNMTTLTPGAMSALRHSHSKQDEFVYVLSGEVVLITEEGETRLTRGMCAGFPAGGSAHHLVNKGLVDVIYLEIGDRTKGDAVSYPDDDIKAETGEDGKWRFARKDGTPY